MNQLNLYDSFVKYFFEMSLPEASREMLDYVRNRAQRAYFYAKEGNPGPVQLNFPIREQLTPDLTLPALFGQPSMRQDKVTIGKKVLATEEINNFIDVLKNKQKPIIVCRTKTYKVLSEQIIFLSKKLNIPIIVNPLSQIRSTKQKGVSIIDASDEILKP